MTIAAGAGRGAYRARGTVVGAGPAMVARRSRLARRRQRTVWLRIALGILRSRPFHERVILAVIGGGGAGAHWPGKPSAGPRPPGRLGPAAAPAHAAQGQGWRESDVKNAAPAYSNRRCVAGNPSSTPVCVPLYRSCAAARGPSHTSSTISLQKSAEPARTRSRYRRQPSRPDVCCPSDPRNVKAGLIVSSTARSFHLFQSSL